jgi:glycosyltransferase involved in cell wall biosynthesis
MTLDGSDVSVLLPVYENDDPDHLRTAIDSVVDQTVTPGEVLIVQDGPVPSKLATVLDEYAREHASIVAVHQLPENRGLGSALRAGVKWCSNDLVARMDADDVSVCDRLERQLAAFRERPSLGVIGGYIGEFTTDPGEVTAVREVPIDHEAITEMAKFRSPMNHGTVLFRKEAVLAAGNYRPVDRMEDYGLWVRLLQNGVRFANVPEVLVKVRAGEELYDRRGGFEYACEEVRLQWDFYRWGFVSLPRFVANTFLRASLRFLPNSVRATIYARFARSDPDKDEG